VVMCRFPQDALLDGTILTQDILKKLAYKTADLHKTAATHATDDGLTPIIKTIQGNDGQFEAFKDYLSRDKTIALTTSLEQAAQQAAHLLNDRAVNGHIKQCHGDLHLRNICLVDNEPYPFDCIEFNDDFAVIDTSYDLAFLLMDLDERGLVQERTIVLNHYLDATADYGILKVLPLLCAMRACIRAHVGVAIALSHAGDVRTTALAKANQYLTLAVSYMHPKKPQLIAIGGLSGSGKSTLAAKKAPVLGAIWLRSDVVRKQLAGVGLLEPLPQEQYTINMNQRVYAALWQYAEDALRAGFHVIIDAAFLQEAERIKVEYLAKQTSASFQGIWLEVEPSIAIERLNSRTHDVSDATIDVYTKQQGYDTGVVRWERLAA
jgi:uncharacterized protein